MRYLIDNYNEYIRPVQETGRKVCLCIEGGGKGIGFCNMTDEQIADILRKVGTLKSWISNIESYALDLALSGTPVPGFKVVEGRSLRTIPDQKAAIDALAQAGLSEDSYLRPRELKTISDLEKLLTKKGFNTILGQYVVKPQGKPTLVEDTDPRPAMNSAKDDFSEYTN